MVRTQIQLSEEQMDRLKALASRRRVSLAQLVREGVERVLAESTGDEAWRRLWEVVGASREVGAHGAVAAEHDRHLVEIWSRERGLR